VEGQACASPRVSEGGSWTGVRPSRVTPLARQDAISTSCRFDHREFKNSESAYCCEMHFIDLNRTFRPAGVEEDDYSYLLLGTENRNEQPWSEILKSKIVVILASARSGKTEEFRQQANRIKSEGTVAVFCAIEELAHSPIAGRARHCQVSSYTGGFSKRTEPLSAREIRTRKLGTTS
jgi:hypothetical protein